MARVDPGEDVGGRMSAVSGFLSRLGLDLAFSSEKSALLAAFSARFFSNDGCGSPNDDSAEAALEPELLSAIIENEVREMELLVDAHRGEMVRGQEMVRQEGSGCLKDHLAVLQWRLRDCGAYLELCRGCVSSFRARSEGSEGGSFAGRVSGTREMLMGVSKQLLLHVRTPPDHCLLSSSLGRMDGGDDFDGMPPGVDVSAVDPKGRLEEEAMELLERRVEEAEGVAEAMKAANEANQEQQRMLYSAIWDMEVLIGDLKAGVSRAERKAEATEEKCRSLALTNSDLDREGRLLQKKVGRLQKDLGAAADERLAWGDQVRRRTEAVMGLVARVGVERERIHKEILGLMEEKNEM